MKKFFAMLLCLALVAGCLAGCGSTSSSTASADTESKETEASTEVETEEEETVWFGTEDGETITLRLWGGVQPEYGYDQLVANFNEEYADKGVQVEYVRYVNDTSGNLQVDTYLMGGGEIDILMNYSGTSKMAPRAESGLLYDMSDKLAEYGFDLVEEIGEALVYKYINDDGSIYGIPTTVSNDNWIMINVDMFEAAGIDIPYDGWTYSEFLDACEKLTSGEGQDKVYAALMRVNAASTVKNIMCSVLGDYGIYSDDSHTSVNFDNEIWRTGLEWIKNLQDLGYIYNIEDEVSEGLSTENTFLEGKAAMSTAIAYIRYCMDTETYPHDFVTAIVPAPVPDGEEYEDAYYRLHANKTAGGDTISIASSCEYTDAAFEFVMWYITGGMAPLATGGRYPLWSGFDLDSILDIVLENAAGTIDEESLYNYLEAKSISASNKTISTSNETEWASSELTSMFKEEFQAYMYGQQDIDTTIENLVSRGNSLIADAIAAAN